MQAETGNTGEAQLAIKRLVEAHAPLVKEIAMQICVKLPPSIDIGDLSQQGMVGLFLAARDYKADLGASFTTYAKKRIRGEIQEFLRKNDWLSRTSRSEVKAVDDTITRAQQELGRPVRTAELAERMDVPLRQMQSLLADVRGTQLLYFADISPEDGGASAMEQAMGPTADTLEVVEKQETLARMMKLLRRLPVREQKLLQYYYVHEKKLEDIAGEFGVTESRICQLHTQAVDKLRGWLRVCDVPFAAT